jgi:transcriptional regulator with XRE-family HTH domain
VISDVLFSNSYGDVSTPLLPCKGGSKQRTLGSMGTLGDWIKTTRERRGMSQTALADAVGTSRSYMSQIESGRVAFPNADLRRRIAKALGKSHIEIMVAAGELRDDEVKAAGVDSSTPDGPLESELIALIRGINWEPDQAAFAEQVLRQMFEKGRR